MVDSFSITLRQDLVSVDNVSTDAGIDYLFTVTTYDAVVQTDILETNLFTITGQPGGNTGGTGGIVGPSFPQGIVEMPITANGQQVLNLPNSINRGILYINGLIQQSNSFTIIGNIVTIPIESQLLVGDQIAFYY